MKINFSSEKFIFFSFFCCCSFFRYTFKFQWFQYKISMISSKKTNQNLSDYNHFLFIKRLEVNNNQIFSSEKLRNSDNWVSIMITRSSERIFNPMRYNGISHFNTSLIQFFSESVWIKPIKSPYNANALNSSRSCTSFKYSEAIKRAFIISYKLYIFLIL